jgi:hypothetical protein
MLKDLRVDIEKHNKNRKRKKKRNNKINKKKAGISVEIML